MGAATLQHRYIGRKSSLASAQVEDRLSYLPRTLEIQLDEAGFLQPRSLMLEIGLGNLKACTEMVESARHLQTLRALVPGIILAGD